MPPAARLGDMHTCPMQTPGTPPIPHVGGPISIGAPTVLIGGQPAARQGDMAVCVGPPDVIARGCPTVLICGQPAARMGDNTAHGGVIVAGCPTVLIGDAGSGGGGVCTAPPAALLVQPQMPTTAVTTPMTLPKKKTFWGKIASAVAGAAKKVAKSIKTVAALVVALSKAGKDADKKFSDICVGDSTQSCPLRDKTANFEEIAKSVNPEKGTKNCGNIIDAVHARLSGANLNAVAPKGEDGSWSAIEKRFNTKINWGQTFDDAFRQVKDGGHGATAVVGIKYKNSTVSHVVIMANNNGTVAIIEGQGGGEVVTTPERAKKKYGADSEVGVGPI